MTTIPFGAWPSPLTLDVLVEGAVGLSFPSLVDGKAYWVEARPAEAGRQVLMRATPDGSGAEEVFGPEFSARTLVHEYGGLCYAVDGEVVYFSNYADQRLYRVRPGQAPFPLTAEPPTPRAVRFAAPVVTPDGRHVVAVRERHPDPDVPSGVVNDVVAVSTDGTSEPTVLLEGHDFFGHPVLSPDGRRMAWVTWDHPNMPWDESEVWSGELGQDRDGRPSVTSRRRVAGGPSESATEPKFSPDGSLVFISDRTGWWNVYAAAPDGEPDRLLAAMEHDLGAPDWVFGTSSFAVAHDGTILGTWFDGGLCRLGVWHPGAAHFVTIPAPLTEIAQLRADDDGRSVLAVAGSASEPPAVVRIGFPAPGAEGGTPIEVVRTSRKRGVDESYLSLPEPVEFPTEGGLTAHGLFYPPRNADARGPEGERPPLIVSIHGGPTGMARTALNYGIQFWTSRGFAVVDVNYGGSAGYGRAYRERLRGKWGVVDLADCVNAARFLAGSGRADGDRLLIHGGSAGGYTTLCAATFTDVFAAGASYFGIADTTVFVEETHKFESRYTDGLFGPWPDTEEVYRDRSPVAHTERLATPLVIFQGLEDKVVPPDQAEIMVAALDARRVPHAYVPYEGEQHGFRRAENVRRTAEAELYFYGKVLGFEPADELEPVEIVHADRLG
jgi:dipeptidyl aminopeptidase/acylaminoacyl peptidase